MSSRVCGAVSAAVKRNLHPADYFSLNPRGLKNRIVAGAVGAGHFFAFSPISTSRRLASEW
jgi:hypothetical protein